jgi:hypothetical protein
MREPVKGSLLENLLQDLKILEVEKRKDGLHFFKHSFEGVTL